MGWRLFFYDPKVLVWFDRIVDGRVEIRVSGIRLREVSREVLANGLVRAEFKLINPPIGLEYRWAAMVTRALERKYDLQPQFGD